MNHLSPAFMARDEDLHKFQTMQNDTNPEFFTLFLKKQIESIEVSKKARLLCESFESCEIQALIEQ
jgi:hypothetical protein